MRARLGFEELIESPLPTQVGFGFLVKGKYTVLPGSPFTPGTQELYGTSRPCRKLQSVLVRGVPQPFLTRLLLLPAHPGLSRAAKGTRDRCFGNLPVDVWAFGSMLSFKGHLLPFTYRKLGLFLDNQPLFTPS